jgi:hypothetical protein
MRKIAIVGSGIAGLLTAHGLVRAGYPVTLFSDRTPEQWLWECRPTGSAARFAPALAYERELGLSCWEEAPEIWGAQVLYCPQPRNRLATLTGRQKAPGMAVDVRLQSHRWMLELQARGGQVVIESVTLARLEEIATQHDLTVVAAGKAELTSLFERDPARSVYAEPKRAVAMVIVKGPSLALEGIPFSSVKNHIIEGVGEAAWIPYFHRDAGPSWNLIFEAIPGGPMDIFQTARSGAEALACAMRTIETFLPWDLPWARDMQLADELGWLVGKITPTVRNPVGRLPSGRLVTAVGDTAVHFDPLAAQGANNGTRMARHLVERVVARGEGAFDAAWMTETFDQFWETQGRPAYALTNLMLEPLSVAGRTLLVSQYGSDGVRTDGKQVIADAFANGFAHPGELTPLLTDLAAARRFIGEATGRWWGFSALTGALGIGRAQLRHTLGYPPGHPATLS